MDDITVAMFTVADQDAAIAFYTQKLGFELRGDKLATVKTLILTDTADIPVDYKLYRRHDGWMAYDVVIEQVSLVRNYRGSFQDIVHQEGIDGLIARLEVKVAEASAEAAE